MTKLTLYSTLGCHLCELAEQVLARALKPNSYQIHTCDIADSDYLMALYGVRIPVVICEGIDNDLGWPFAEEDVRQWLTQKRSG
jgi:Glutaredoxin-like domain (DUF836).